MTVALTAAVALPAVAGAALLAAGRRADRVASPVGVAVPALVLVVVLVADGVDGLSRVVLVLVAAVALLVLLAAARERQSPAARFSGLMLLFVAAVVLTASASNLPALLAGWEVMGATSGALIALRLDDRDAVSAGLTAFVVTRSADLGLYLAAGAAVAGGSGLAIADLPAAVEPWRSVVAAGMIVAGLGKAAQLPFSFWLSRAMAGPATVSALLHSAAMVAMGGYLLLRIRPLLAAVAWAGPATAWAGAATAVVLGLVALAQTDLKQLLAASTAAQLGLVVLAAGVGSVAGGAAQLVAHAATKAALFLLAGLWLQRWGARRLEDLRGALGDDRPAAVLAIVAAAALAGLPPLSIWAAKDLIVAGASLPLGLAAIAASVIAAGYSARIVRALLAPAAVRRGPTLVPVLVPVAVLAAAAVLGGVLAVPPVAHAFAALVGGRSDPAPDVLLVLGSALLAGAGFAAGLRWQPRPVPLLARWLDLERLAVRGVGVPLLRLADRAARVDDLLARTLARTPDVAMAFARTAARLDDAGPAGLLRGTARAAAAAGRAARRPQTGRLHRYYLLGAAATAALIAAAVAVR